MSNTLDPAANFCKVSVSTGYDASATTLVLVDTDPHLSSLPDPATAGAYNLTWWDATNYPDPCDDPNVEIVRCTAFSSPNITVTRAQESTTATTKNTAGATYKVMLAPTKKFRTDLEAAAVDVGSVYGYVTEAAYGAVGDGVTDDYAAFAAAVAALTHIVIPSGTYKISSDLTVANTITLEFRQGASISVDSGKTLTLNCNVIAGNWQITQGAGTVTWGTRSIIRYDRWDGTAADKLQITAASNLEVLDGDVTVVTGHAFKVNGVAIVNPTIVESAELAVDAGTIITAEITHGLGYTPSAGKIALSAYVSSGLNEADLPGSRGIYIIKTDGTKIYTYLYLTDTAAAGTKMKIVAFVWPE